jgi:hypothetical protein
MTRQDIVAVLGEPAGRKRTKQGHILKERLYFEPLGTMPSLVSQPIRIEIDLATNRAIRITCSEDFRLRSPEIEELDKKGIYGD